MIIYIFVFKKNYREFLEKKRERERELTNEIPGNYRSRNSFEDYLYMGLKIRSRFFKKVWNKVMVK